MKDVTPDYLELLIEKNPKNSTFNILKDHLAVFELESLEEVHLNYDLLVNAKNYPHIQSIIPKINIGEYRDREKNDEWQEYVSLKRKRNIKGYAHESKTYFSLDNICINNVRFINRKYFNVAVFDIHENGVDPVECLFFTRMFDAEINENSYNSIKQVAFSDPFATFYISAQALPLIYSDKLNDIKSGDKRLIILDIIKERNEGDEEKLPVANPVFSQYL